MSNWEDILNKVTDYLNSLSLELSYTATNSYRPKVELSGMSEDASVVVFPRNLTRERINRNSVRLDHGVSIVVTAKVDGALLNLDSMVDLVQEMALALDEYNYADGWRTLSTADIDPIFDHSKLTDNAIFQSIINIQVAKY